jgi:hypothetical protein
MSQKTCCCKGCQRTGEPHDGFTFFICEGCLEELENLLDELYAKRISSRERKRG